MKIGISASETIEALSAAGEYSKGLPSEFNEGMYHFGTHYVADLTSLILIYFLVVYLLQKGFG